MVASFLAEDSPAEGKLRSGKPANRQAESLLQAAEAGAGTLQDVDSAYAYWLIARALSQISADEERAVLKKSCEAAVAFNRVDQETAMREKVQLDCLRRMMTLQPDLAGELLARATPNVRQQIFAATAPAFAGKGNTEATLTMLSSEISQGARYPYGRALEAIRAIPADDVGSKDRIFAQALIYYRQKHNRFDVGPDDLGNLVVHLWREISPGLVLQAIDELLDIASEENDANSHLDLTLKSGAEGASFASLYQYRLFELLPVLRELNPGRADDLTNKNAQINSALHKYKNGLQSFSGNGSGNQNDNVPFSMALHNNPGPANSTDHNSISMLSLQVEQRGREILHSAQQDPETALTNALLLPDAPSMGGSAKVDLLLEIAQRMGKEKQRTAIAALQQASKLLEGYPLLTQCRYLVLITDAYLQAGDTEKAQSVLKEILRAVVKLYAIDTNSDDPNRALKSAWPSTVIARACVALAGRISPRRAEAMIAELPDPDLRVFARIELACALLKIPSYPALVHERHNQDRNYRVDVFPILTAQESLH